MVTGFSVSYDDELVGLCAGGARGIGDHHGHREYPGVANGAVESREEFKD